MLRIRNIEIKNFACFDHIGVDPSIDPDRPMTVIRAENGSGKTTFLRAVRWGMYSEKGLPGEASRFSLHPAWWNPTDDGITTEVAIEFETDGSTRHEAIGNDTSTIYQLVRTVTTIGKQTATDDEPDFRRINEQVRLMVRDASGTWSAHPTGADAVIAELLPWELRDFFVMDADEAADFVGGSEGQVISIKEVEKKTTSAIHSLLGIDVFHSASERVDKIGKAFGAAATKAVGDADLDALQSELDQLRDERDKLTGILRDENEQIADLQDRAARANDNLETELKGIGAAEEIRERRTKNRATFARTNKVRNQTLASLANELESTDLLASLAQDAIVEVHAQLKPLYDSGKIPQKHLTFVRQLLDTGTCVCGQDVTEDGLHRRHIEDLLQESAEEEERANYLGHLYEATDSLFRHSQQGTAWDTKRHELSTALAEADQQLEEIGIEYRDIETKLDLIEEDKIQVIRDEINTLKTQQENTQRSVALHQQQLPDLNSTVDSLEKRIQQRQKGEQAAGDKRAAQNLAALVTKVLDNAYKSIQLEQVTELSHRMNRLFANMAANVTAEDVTEKRDSKATLRMIAEVGVRPIEDQSETFEIFALNQRGRAMPAIEINGASRRVLALSFVLALCAESRTEAPLLADSLLNSMSGAVRRNTLSVTAENSGQPILLLTGSDLETPSEIETIETKAGATYTLTGQWAAIGAGDGGDVINRTDERSVSLICNCGPREYCNVCERTGQAGTPGWTKQP